MRTGKNSKKSPKPTSKADEKLKIKSSPKSSPKKLLKKPKEIAAAYRESHAIGRRQSTSVPTYSENGRLYYDLHVKFGIEDSLTRPGSRPNQEDVGSKNHDIASSSSKNVQQNGNSKVASPRKAKKSPNPKKNAVKRTKPSSPVPVAYARREASLNAAAKVNMLFEPSKEPKVRRKSLPTPASVEVPESPVDDAQKRLPPKKRTTKVTRNRNSEPVIPFSPPRKRVAGLNAMAIISAVMTTPKRTSSSQGKVEHKSKPRSKTKGVDSPVPPKPEEDTPTPPTVVEAPQKVSSSTSPNPLSSPPQIPSTNESQAAPVVVPTVERYQSQKVISYGPKCIGVENISRQIIHVPSQTQTSPPHVPAITSPQRARSPPFTSTPSRHNSPVVVSPPSAQIPNTSAVFLPETSFNSPPPRASLILPTDLQSCLPSQFYLGGFGHPSPFSPHAFVMSPSLYQPLPAPPFHFLHTSPFAAAATYIHSPAHHMPATNCMFHMPLSPLFNPMCHAAFCAPPQPILPPPPPPATTCPPLTIEPADRPPQQAQQPQPPPSNPAPPIHRETPKRVDRSVSPIPELVPLTQLPMVIMPQQNKKTPIKRVVVERKPAPCLWAWEGVAKEELVFVKVSLLVVDWLTHVGECEIIKFLFLTQPDSPPVLRQCYPSMRHRKDGMVVCPGDNVLLCSGPDRHNAPHVAKVTALFVHPDTGKLVSYILSTKYTTSPRTGGGRTNLYQGKHSRTKYLLQQPS